MTRFTAPTHYCTPYVHIRIEELCAPQRIHDYGWGSHIMTTVEGHTPWLWSTMVQGRSHINTSCYSWVYSAHNMPYVRESHTMVCGRPCHHHHRRSSHIWASTTHTPPRIPQRAHSVDNIMRVGEHGARLNYYMSTFRATLIGGGCLWCVCGELRLRFMHYW